MASQAINAKSFCNYVVSLCTYFNDATPLSDTNKTQLYNYLIEGITPSTAINIKTALAILNKINTYASSAISISVSEGTLSSILSLNTAKALVDIAFPSSNRSKFCTLNHIYDDTGNLNTYNYMRFIFYLAAPSTETYTLKGTLVGGGGGGSGGQAHDGNKDSNFRTKGGGGGKGGISSIYLNGQSTYATDGGDGAAAWDAGPSGGNPSWAKSGSAGTDGTTMAVDMSIKKLQELKITPGYGGGGGGGFGCSASNSTDYRSWAVDTWGVNATEAKGGNGAERSTFTNDDHVMGGGGGEGGHGYGYSSTGIGSSNSSGPQHGGGTTNASYQSDGIGGKGGYAGSTTNDNQPSTLGAGGKPGKAKNGTDTYTCANGGNGGNSGGFIIDTTGNAASALFIWKQ